MIRKIIKPHYKNVTIDIPAEYVDKEIEVIIFKIDEISKNNPKKSLRGVFNKYADTSKIKLENQAWKNHIIKKFK